MKIQIYADEGVSSFSLKETVRTFKTLLPRTTITLMKSRALIKGGWEKNSSLIIFPGGRDIPYDRLLKGEGIRRLNTFVREGGIFIGICAGAYFASKEVIFEKGTDMEVVEPRDLHFFPDAAIGTLFREKVFVYDSEKGAHAPLIRCGETQLPLYYNGGCYFKDAHLHPVEILGTYEEEGGKAAIISSSIGKGKAVLSGVHFEVAPTPLLKKLTFPSVYKALKAHEPKRQHLLKQLLLAIGSNFS
jgi:biotin--protein ligase